LTPHDVATFVGAVILLTAVGTAAAYLPAARAARTSPLEGLKVE
jgi:ABC-type antimicrobial peptide transport system permease subunit